MNNMTNKNEGNFEEFKALICDKIKDFLPAEYEDALVTTETVIKNNDRALTGLNIHLENNMSPCIYIDAFYEDFLNGRDMEDILKNLAFLMLNYETSGVDTSMFLDFNKAKSRITPRLVNLELNGKYLINKPYRIIAGDLAVIYIVNLSFEDEDDMGGALVVTNEVMARYGIDEEELYRIALDNLSVSEPVILSMGELMVRAFMKMNPFIPEEIARDYIAQDMSYLFEEGLMYSITSDNLAYGASLILCREAMENVIEKVGRDFIIIPSSIHECLILPGDPENMDLDYVRQMVYEVNGNIQPGDILSYSVYGYDKDKGIYILSNSSKRGKMTA